MWKFMEHYDKDDKDSNENPYRIAARCCYLIHIGCKKLLLKNYDIAYYIPNQEKNEFEITFAP